MRHCCLPINPEAKPPGTSTKACNPSYVCVRVCEGKFSSALNWGQRKLIQLSVEANNLLFSQRKKVPWRVLMVQTLVLEHTHTHKPQCRFGGVSSSENASCRSDGWCVFEPCTLVTYNTTQSSWPPEGIRRLRNWHLDCANFNTLLSNSPSCAGLIVRAMLLWPCGVIGAVIEFDSCYSGSAVGARVPTAVPDSCEEEEGTVT